MTGKLDLTNQSALEFNRSRFKELRKICFPLKQFGITNFTYIRFFNGGKRLYIATNPDWVELYIQNHFQDVTEHTEHYVPQGDVRYSFWTSFKRNKVFDAMAALNLGNGFTIYEKHGGYVDYFDFVSNKENSNVINFYLNNLSLLELFIKDFKCKAANIIDPADENKLIIPKNKIIFEDIEHTAFVDDAKLKKFMQEIEFKPRLNP